GVQVILPLGSTTILRPVQSAVVGDRTADVRNLWESAGAPDPHRVIETTRQQAPPGFSPTPTRRRFRSSLPMFVFLRVLRSMGTSMSIPKRQRTHRLAKNTSAICRVRVDRSARLAGRKPRIELVLFVSDDERSGCFWASTRTDRPREWASSRESSLRRQVCTERHACAVAERGNQASD